MNDKLGLVTLTLIAALSVAGCGNEEKVHESWKAPPAKEEVDDATLAGTVQTKLRSDPEVRHLDIRVEADKGTVTLSGTVDNQAQMDRVNMLTWMVEGIGKVDNKMSLRNG
jgi:hyperosmotically inducible periplasmic protein